MWFVRWCRQFTAAEVPVSSLQRLRAISLPACVGRPSKYCAPPPLVAAHLVAYREAEDETAR